MIVANDLNIESKLDVYNPYIQNNTVIEQKYDRYYIDALNNIKDLKFIDNQYDFLYPIHKTIQNELEKEGLKVIKFNKDDDIDGLTSYEFEVIDNGYDIAKIEYEVIKKLNLESKNIVITVY